VQRDPELGAGARLVDVAAQEVGGAADPPAQRAPVDAELRGGLDPVP
jgi:hypothetical protein